MKVNAKEHSDDETTTQKKTNNPMLSTVTPNFDPKKEKEVQKKKKLWIPKIDPPQKKM